MQYLRQNTATSIMIGPFLDENDGKTPETALTVTSIDCDVYKGVTKTDLSLTASGGNNDCVHVANGFYSLELTTSNTDTLGRVLISANISGALPIWHEFMVVPANVYDSLFGSDYLNVELTAAGVDSILDEVIGDSVHNTNNSFGAMLHAIYCILMQKTTVTSSNETHYKLDDATVLKSFTLNDNGTTVTKQ